MLNKYFPRDISKLIFGYFSTQEVIEFRNKFDVCQGFRPRVITTYRREMDQIIFIPDIKTLYLICYTKTNKKLRKTKILTKDLHLTYDPKVAVKLLKQDSKRKCIKWILGRENKHCNLTLDALKYDLQLSNSEKPVTDIPFQYYLFADTKYIFELLSMHDDDWGSEIDTNYYLLKDDRSDKYSKLRATLIVE